MSQLSIDDIVSVDVVMNPLAAAVRNFGSLLILGSTPGVIDTTERYRSYSTLIGVTNDFGSTAPEAVAAALFFGQNPQPSQLYIGTFAQTATAGRLVGGPLTTAQQALANFTAVTTGALDLTIDGSAETASAINLSGATNLNGVASIVTTALDGKATVTWNASSAQFIVTSATTGASSSVSFSTAPGSGTDLGPLMNLQASGGGRLAAGSAVETPIQGVEACAAANSQWYALQLAPASSIQDSDRLAIAAFIEGESPARIYGITSSQATILDPSITSDIASLLQQGKYNRTFIQYSSTTPHAAASFFGRAATVDFDGNDTTITMKFKTEPGVTPENLTETQAAALKAKNCNVYANYTNSQAIVQEGVMCGGYFFDEIQGTDWMQNAAQIAVLNELLTMPKIPQTDAGINQLVTALDGVGEQAVTNGLSAPGVWTGPPLGAIATGQTLAKGYYTYAPPIASQSQADRAARKSPALQMAVKLAGAVHFASVVINVNR